MNPWVWLAAVIVLEALAINITYNRWQAAVVRENAVQGKFDAFVQAVKDRGEQAAHEAEEKEKVYRETANHLRDRGGRLALELERLRSRPISSPDGNPVSVTTCGPALDGGTGGERVPLEAYRSLQERAALDAARLQAWEEYRIRNGIPLLD